MVRATGFAVSKSAAESLLISTYLVTTSISAASSTYFATLAAALCHRRASSRLRPAGQVLIYPGLGGDCFDLESYRANDNAPLLSTADVAFYRGVRCEGEELPVSDPEFFPLVADDFSSAPPTVAFSADVDPLRDDARLYVEKLCADGIAAEWINETGLVHDYLRARHVSDLAGAAFARITDAIIRLADSMDNRDK